MFLHVSGSHSVHRRGDIPACLAGLGGGGVSQHALQVSRPTLREGGGVEGSGLGGGLHAHTRRGWGVWPGGSPGPHWGRGVSRPTPGGVYQHALRLLLRAVRFLLECIFVNFSLTFVLYLRSKHCYWLTYSAFVFSGILLHRHKPWHYLE